MNIRHWLMSIILLLTAGTTVFAQHTINGRISNAAGIGIESALIVASNTADSSLITTGISDSNGLYSISLPSLNEVFLKVSVTGYDAQIQTVKNLQQNIITLHFSLKKTAGQLTAVTITAQKPLLERKADRIIFNVGSSIAASGTNALEAVKKAPGVLVKPQDNTISLAGKGTVNVLIDDRLMQLSGEDLFAYLQSIPSDNVDRIEVITTPPARYAAAGNAGLINIVMKKNRKNGMNGEVRMGYEQSGYGTGISGGNINYRHGKLNVYANASYTNESKKILEQLNTSYSDQSYLLTDPYKRHTQNFQNTAGADYQLHNTGILGIQVTSSLFDRLYTEPNSDIIITHTPSAALDSIVHTAAIGTMKNHNDILNVNYVWSIDTTGKKLTLNANRLWFGSDRNRDYETETFYDQYRIPGTLLTRNKNTGMQDMTITTAQADLDLPYQWVSLSLGGRFSATDNNSRNNFYYYENGDYVDDPAVSNEFQYRERVTAGYVNASKTLKKWELQAGLRGEYTATEGHSLKLAQTNTNQYFNLFPTIFIQYTANGNNSFNINYSKRIDRPGYRALDPYRSYSSPYSYIEGNPFLQPNSIHSIEAAYTYKSKYSLTAFYQNSPNTFGAVFFADTVHKTTYVRTENYGDFINYGINASASITPLPRWEMQLLASGSIQKAKPSYTAQVITIKPVPTGVLVVNNSMPLNKGKTLLVQANVFVISSYMNDLQKCKPQCNVDTGIRALFFDKKLVVNLTANDLFRTLTVRGENQVSGQTLDSYFDERNVRLMINYRFGNSKLKAQRQRSTGIEEESKRT